MIEYEAENYPRAAVLLTEILEENPGHIAANFYAGLIDLISERDPHAISRFQRVIEFDSDDYQEPATWFLGLTYLRTGEISHARRILEEIIGQEGLFCEEAMDLMYELIES